MAANKHLTSARIYQKLIDLAKPTENAVYINNRNPRNLELIKIAYKPNGFHLEKPGKCFWHKLILIKKPKCITAQVHHYKNEIVLQASTDEWSLRKQLYTSYDTAAYINLGRVFAQRCLEAGLIEMLADFEAPPNGKVEKFLREVEKNGVSLTESERYIKASPSEQHRMEKPWEIQLD